MPRICLTIADKTPQPYRFALETDVVAIGRADSSDVIIDHGSISSKHCEMKRMSGGYILVDNNSTNGIYLDGEEMEVIDLQDGMDAEVGDVTFNYTLTEEEKEELAGEKFKKRQRKKRKERVKEARKQVPKRSTAHTPSASPAFPAAVSSSALASSQKSGGRDFGIFAAFAIIAALAFWLGLGSAHKDATKSDDDPYGRSLLEDIQGG
jgi:pSer/pThr/pTyr-binding forkhead associated (FHA) protein